MKRCAWCGKKLSGRQRVYCGRDCQSKGVAKKNTTALVLSRSCDFCGVDYAYHPNWKKDKNTRYCSRECKDAQQKESYVGEGNPVYGSKWTDERRVKQLDSLRVFWSDSTNKEHHYQAMQIAANRLGFWPGTDEKSQERRRQTNLKKYGVEHPWMNPKIRHKCEITTLQLYGKHSWQIARDSIVKKNSILEIMVANVLDKIEIKYEQSYVVVDGSVHREFDFFLPNFNVLIETDGDYWHGNPTLYVELNDTQRNSQINDRIKDNLAASLKIPLLRYWESEIYDSNFIVMLKKDLGLLSA